jgi:hypothetical protein
MSGGKICQCLTGGKKQRDDNRKIYWEVLQRNCNHSSFNGGHYTSSAWSEVRCTQCFANWRTKANYVNELPDGVRLSR